MISREDVEKLSELARVKLSGGEVERLQKDISEILDYIGQVSNTTGVPTGEQPVRNVMRADMPRGKDDVLAGKEENLRAAFPERQGNFNVVRKIIQKDE